MTRIEKDWEGQVAFWRKERASVGHSIVSAAVEFDETQGTSPTDLLRLCNSFINAHAQHEKYFVDLNRMRVALQQKEKGIEA